MTDPEFTPSPATRIAFIGAGNMGRSLIGGLLAAGATAEQIIVVEPLAEAREALRAQFGIQAHASPDAALVGADAVVLAVKPQIMARVCATLVAGFPAGAVAISIAAGITTTQLDGWLGGQRAVVRAMPNTPALLGAGAAGLFANARTRAPQRQLADWILRAVGTVAWIEDEAQMDLVTALSGSGPAYVFLLVEAMQEAAVRLGLPAEVAARLAAQTALGAGQMLVASGESPATLRQRVTSPGGTTAAALASFESAGFRAIVLDAVTAAARRGAELASEAGS